MAETYLSEEPANKNRIQQIDMKYASFRIDFHVQVFKRIVKVFGISALKCERADIGCIDSSAWHRFHLMLSDICNEQAK